MSFLSSMTLGLFRRSHDGRRVCGAPVVPGFPRVWYLVSDADAPRIEQRFKRYFVFGFLLFLPLAVALTPDFVWVWPVVALIATPLTMHLWVFRGLARTHVAAGDLEPVDRRLLELAQSQAMGEPWLWTLTVAGVAMAALAFVVAFSDGVWWSWLGAIMFTTLTLMMARQLVRLRRAPQPGPRA